MKGDNRSSLSWSTSERFRSEKCRSCAIHFIAIATRWDLVVVEGVHIEGVRNILCDGLSRDVSVKDSGFEDTDIFEWESSTAICALLQACDPRTDPAASDLLRHWVDAVDLVGGLLE